MVSEFTTISPADQVVRVQAGTSLGELNRSLHEYSQTIPIPISDFPSIWCAQEEQSIGELVAWNLPHGLAAQHGTWRDWVLGIGAVLADGTMVRSGSSVVKSVAGYDLHRLLVGSRNTLAKITEVILRTCPISQVQKSQLVEVNRKFTLDDDWYIVRCLTTDFDVVQSIVGADILANDFASNTFWCKGLVPNHLRSRSHVAIWTSSEPILGKHELTYMRHLKEIFDPTNMLNPGAMGIF